MTKPLKVEFAPGCFDDWDGTQEELAALIADIKNMAEAGTLWQNSTPVSEDDAEEMLKIMEEREKRQ